VNKTFKSIVTECLPLIIADKTKELEQCQNNPSQFDPEIRKCINSGLNCCGSVRRLNPKDIAEIGAFGMPPERLGK